MSDYVVEFNNVSFYRGEKKILNGIDLRLKPGTVTSILGPSGCGKTTLLKLIAGQLKPDYGDVKVNGESLVNLNAKKLYKIRKQIGFLFQSGALFSDLSVFDNIAFPLREHTNLSETMIHDIVLMKLNAVGLRGARSLMPSELSGGMTRRVALARTIALDPAMVLYDEPFAGQDPISKGVLVKLIKTMTDILGITGVLVSHDVADSLSISDYVYLISGGKIVAHGTPADLLSDKSSWVQQFTNGLPDGPVSFHYSAPSLVDEFLWIPND